MTTISIGITAYNEEKNIKNLLNSVLSQKQEGFVINEIIIISDKSTDNTDKIISSIKDSRIKYIKGNKREGQNLRLNQIVSLMSKRSDCLLRLEADTLPKNKYYILNLVRSIPPNRQYSIISGEQEFIYTSNFFNQIITIGNEFKKEIYEKAMKFPNLYLIRVELLSKRFLKTFKWPKDLHDDSYCYRRAIQSGLPVLRTKKAKLLIKAVDNIGDYLLQSGKFQKARKAESKYSKIYKARINYKDLLFIAIKHISKKPFLFICYITVLIFSRLYSCRLPKYSPYWETYKSSKNFYE